MDAELHSRYVGGCGASLTMMCEQVWMLPASLAVMPTEGEAVGMQNEPCDLGGVIQVLNRHSTGGDRDRLP